MPLSTREACFYSTKDGTAPSKMDPTAARLLCIGLAVEFPGPFVAALRHASGYLRVFGNVGKKVRLATADLTDSDARCVNVQGQVR